MMKCPICGGDTKVINSRLDATENEVRRRRVCLSCGQRITTIEFEIEEPGNKEDER